MLQGLVIFAFAFHHFEYDIMDIARTNRADQYTYNPTDHQPARLAVLSGAHMADALEWREDSGVSFEGLQAPNLRFLPHKFQHFFL
jgi:hypothetical protein